MPNIKVYQVFCAAPGDLDPERDTVERVINRLNSIHYKNKPFRLEYRGWNIDTISQYGAEPQDAINEQLGSHFEIFVLMFWTRIGTPTKSAISGTMEEFLAAAARWEKTKFPKIGIFFKETPVNHWKQDIEQLAGLHQVQKDVRSKALITYFGADNFESAIETFLARNIDILTTQRDDPDGVPTGPIIQA